jgi:hypothetical protein
MNIVLVHYLEIKGGKQNFNRAKEAEENAGLSADSPACSNSFASQSQVASQSMDAESPISGQISEYEDAETDNCRASSRYHPFTEMQQPVDGIMMDKLLGASAPSVSVNNLGKPFTLPSKVLGKCQFSAHVSLPMQVILVKCSLGQLTLTIILSPTMMYLLLSMKPQLG